MTALSGADRFHAFPMGPRLRGFLGIPPEAYRGDTAPVRAADDEEAFASFLAAAARAEPPANEDELIDLLDELVAMDLPQATLRLADACPELWSGKDFRGLLAVGVA